MTILNPLRRLDVGRYHFVTEWQALRQGDAVGSERNARISVGLIDYRRCEGMLATLLGIEPAAETWSFYQAWSESRPLPG
jgi:hypothetical protein